MQSCLYEGWVTHQRLMPAHRFRYRLCSLYLDLSELKEVFASSRWWSTQRPAVARFRRADHLGDPAVPLDTAVRQLVERRLGQAPSGPIRLLTHPRYFGYVMNPISIFYCFDQDANEVTSLVVEVHNTPWNERHCYVLDGRDAREFRRATAKEFHVSPFLPMDMNYRWQVDVPGETLSVHIANRHNATPATEQADFVASMVLQRREISRASLRNALVRFPFMTHRVWLGIYFQALRLWLKKTNFYTHPKNLQGVNEQ